MEKTKESGSDKPELDREFNQLRELTNQYTILGDVCGTYAVFTICYPKQMKHTKRNIVFYKKINSLNLMVIKFNNSNAVYTLNVR